MRLKNRHILITGGGSGIGLETARFCRAEGASVAVLDRSAAALKALRAELVDIITIECDVTIEEQVTGGVAAAEAALGRIDGLVNSAGIGTRRSFADTTLEIMQRDIAVNLLGPFLIAKEAHAALARAGTSAIVNIASGLALRPTEGRTAYGASKGGLVVMSKAMAVDLAPDGIRVNVVCPGLIDTPMTVGSAHGPQFSAEQLSRLMDRRIIRRKGTAREVAGAVIFLLSEEASYITGSVLAVDGGGSMH